MRKVIASLAILATYAAFVTLVEDPYAAAKTPLIGDLAVDQLSDSNLAYVKSTWTVGALKAFNSRPVDLLVLGLAMWGLWKTELKELFSKIKLGD